MSRRAAQREGEDALHSLLRGDPLAAPSAVVAAHPDDECAGMAGVMAQMVRMTLISVTDGAPPGSADPAALAALRRDELARSLAAAAVRPVRRCAYAMTDSIVAQAMPELVARLEADLAEVDVVFTHPFEGGHIDHDACAAAVQLACARRSAAGARAPIRLEFTSYHACRGRVRAGAFRPGASMPEVEIVLESAARRRREAALSCHASQEMNLRYFRLDRERFRVAPVYDLSAGLPQSETLYGRAAADDLRAKMRSFAL